MNQPLKIGLYGIGFKTVSILALAAVLGLAVEPGATRGAEPQDTITPAGAKWIAAGEGEPSLKMPGVHVRGRTPVPPGQKEPMPIFRKTFTLDNAPVSRARVAVCGLGHFELSINGRTVGDHVLDPPGPTMPTPVTT